MTSNVFTKNLARPQFEKHVEVFVGENRYMSGGTPKGRVLEDENMSRECRDFNSSKIK